MLEVTVWVQLIAMLRLPLSRPAAWPLWSFVIPAEVSVFRVIIIK